MKLTRLEYFLLFAVYELSGGRTDISVDKVEAFKRAQEFMRMTPMQFRQHRARLVEKNRVLH